MQNIKGWKGRLKLPVQQHHGTTLMMIEHSATASEIGWISVDVHLFRLVDKYIAPVMALSKIHYAVAVVFSMDIFPHSCCFL